MDELAAKWDMLLVRLARALDGKAAVVETHRSTDRTKTVFAEAEFRSPVGNGPELQLRFEVEVDDGEVVRATTCGTPAGSSLATFRFRTVAAIVSPIIPGTPPAHKVGQRNGTPGTTP